MENFWVRLIFEFVLADLSTICFGILLNIPRRAYHCAGAIGGSLLSAASGAGFKQSAGCHYDWRLEYGGRPLAKNADDHL